MKFLFVEGFGAGPREMERRKSTLCCIYLFDIRITNGRERLCMCAGEAQIKNKQKTRSTKT